MSLCLERHVQWMSFKKKTSPPGWVTQRHAGHLARGAAPGTPAASPKLIVALARTDHMPVFTRADSSRLTSRVVSVSAWLISVLAACASIFCVHPHMGISFSSNVSFHPCGGMSLLVQPRCMQCCEASHAACSSSIGRVEAHLGCISAACRLHWSCSGGATEAGKLHARRIDVAGLERAYELYLPTSTSSEVVFWLRLRLVYMVHLLGGLLTLRVSTRVVCRAHRATQRRTATQLSSTMVPMAALHLCSCCTVTAVHPRRCDTSFVSTCV